MSLEVICLSSDEDDKKSSQKEAEKKAQKRKLTDHQVPFLNVDAKKQKVENSPQPGCSKDFHSTEREREKKEVIKPQLIVRTKIPIPKPNQDVFQNFIETCLERRDDSDTKKVLFKLEKLHKQLSLFHKNDKEFRLYVNNCLDKITQGLSNDIYTPILDVHTEIKSRIQNNNPLEQTTTDNAKKIGEQVQVSKKDMKKIILLENSIQECLKKIKQLEEKEVDFNDEQDSVYIQADKYKKRLVQMCNALTKLNGDTMMRRQMMKKKIKRKDVPDEMTGIPLVDEAILNFVNADIGKINQLKHLGTQRLADHVKMPEYLDILKCVQKCNKQSNLDLSQEKMTKLARKAFQAVGNFLKKKRTDETKFYIQSFLDDEKQDPAIEDDQLNQKLQKNKKEGDKKLEEIFKKYVDKQEGLSQEDMEKQAQTSSDDDDDSADESDAENASSDTNLSPENSISQVDDKNCRVESNLVAASSLTDNDKLETETTSDKNEGSQKQLFQDESDTLDLSRGKEDDKGVHDKSNKKETKIVENEAPVTPARSEKEIISEQHANFEKNDQTIADEDDDIVVIDDNDHLDGSPQVRDPLDIDNKVPENKQAEPCTLLKAVSAVQVDDSNKGKTSFIKVCAFAKPPPAWGDTSPEKVKKKLQIPIQEALQDFSRSECIDLTKEREKRLPTTSTRSINPLANIKRTIPSKRVVIVKNVINNYNVPLSLDGVEKSIILPRSSTTSDRNVTIVSKRKGNNHTGNIARTPWLSKDKAAASKDKRTYIK